MKVNQNFSENAKNDYALVLRALDGDQKAFASIMDRYKDSIYYMVLKIVNNKEDAMDLTVEVFAKAFEKLESYRPDFAFSTWLFKMATNFAIDSLRRKRFKQVSIDKISEEEYSVELNLLLVDSDDPEQKSIQKQEDSLLQELVNKLPIRYRILINLFYFDELSIEQIALQLDLSKNTVKGQLARARDLLYVILTRKKKARR